MSAVSMRTTTVKYQTKPQAAVQYEIALLSGALVYNPNQSDKIEGKLEWRVYKIEGDQRLPMSNSQKGMKCYCGYSDSPSTTAGVDTTDNVTFDDGGAAQVAYNSNSTKQFTIIYGSVTGGVFTQLARLDVPVNVIGKDAAVVASIDFDNNNATILYNSIKGTYVEASYPVSNISVVEDGKDISQMAEIYVEVYGLSARIKGRGYNIPLSGNSSAELTTADGSKDIISVTVNSVESTGYVLAKYTDSAGITHTTKFNVSRSVGRYAAEIITTPTQISYNQTTGIASSSTITATLNVIDIYGNRTPNAQFSTFGAMIWRYVGENWPDPVPKDQSVTKLEITNPDFTKSGVEFAFIDGSGNQLDYETVPFSSVTNGGDAYLVNVASMNVAVVLTSISYGTPTGDVTNVVYMTKNNAVLPSGVRYDVPGDDGEKYALATDSDTANNVSYNGWVFNYSYQEGRLKSSLVRVNEGSPTSVHIPIDVIYPTDNITRSVMISYSAIQKGPAGRSYKPNTPVLYDPTKKYVWNDKQRDFIYYAFKVDENGEQDDEKGVLSYFQYGVKDYGKELTNTPPTAKGGDTNWELVSEYKSIIVNCLFGTNAVLGGMVFTADTQTSVSEYSKGIPNIVINGSDGTFVANKAIIRGEVNATGGTFDKCIIKDTCTITKINAVNGTIGGFAISDSSIYTKENAYSGGSGVNSFSESKFFLHASGYSSAFLGFSATNKWAGIGLNTLPSTSATTALARFEDTVTNTFDWTKIGIYLNVAGAKTYDDIGKGNCAIYAEQGVYTGFRIGTKLTTKSVTLTKMDNVIICYNTEDITITLPSDCEKGQVMMVRPAGTKGVTIEVKSGTILRNNDTMGNGVTSFTCGGKWMHFFIYDKYNNTWIMGYTN